MRFGEEFLTHKRRGTQGMKTTSPPSPVTGDWFVSTTGSDTNAGTELQPFATLMKAHDVASPGQIILMEDGTYTLPTTTTYSGYKSFMSVTKSGIAGNPITVRARNRWGAILEGNSMDREYAIIAIAGASYWTFDGLRMRNAIEGVLLNATGTDFTVRRSWIHNISTGRTDLGSTGRSGIFSIYNNTIVDRCLIHDIGRAVGSDSLDHGIYLKDGDGHIIRNSLIHTCTKGWAIQLYSLPMANGTILNNSFAFPNDTAGQPGHIVVGADLTNWDIANNISFNPNTCFLYNFAGTHVGCLARNNIVNVASLWNAVPGGFTNSGNLIGQNPLLVDVSTSPYDFHTQGGSPARGAGLTFAQVTDDYDGTARVVPYDMGAYES